MNNEDVLKSLVDSYQESLKETLSETELKLYSSLANNELHIFIKEEGYEKVGTHEFMGQTYNSYRKTEENSRIKELKEKIKMKNNNK